VRADRGVFIAHILTIARAYMEAGFPGNPVPLPSFEAWSNLIRGALIWLSRSDPAGSVARNRAEDPHRQALAAFLDAFPTVPARRDGFTAAELVAYATADDGYVVTPGREEFAAVLREVASDRRGRPSATRLGYWLRSQRGRVVGARKLSQCGPDKAREWFVEDRTRSNGSDGAMAPYDFPCPREKASNCVFGGSLVEGVGT